jgi:hypothetical protein
LLFGVFGPELNGWNKIIRYWSRAIGKDKLCSQEDVELLTRMLVMVCCYGTVGTGGTNNGKCSSWALRIANCHTGTV